MQVISFVTQKGGSGKSALATSCAVVAEQTGKTVFVLDLDPQGTADDWYLRRDAETPQVAQITSRQLDPLLKGLAKKRVDFVFIDTPGKDDPATAAAIRHSTLCVVPSKTSPADLRAARPTVDAIERLKKPVVFVLNQIKPGRKGRDHYRIREAEAALSILGIVAPVRIGDRVAHQDAWGAALGVTEFEPDGTAAAEINHLWKWLNRKMGKINGKGKTH